MTDLQLPGAVFPWDHTRKYDSLAVDGSGAAMVTANGARWQNDALGPFVYLQITTIPGPPGGTVSYDYDLFVCMTMSTKQNFTASGTSLPSSFSPPADYEATMDRSGSGATEIYTLTQTDTGRIYVFYGTNVSIAATDRGRLKELTSREYVAAGLTGIEYTYNLEGFVSQVTTAEPQSWTIDYTYYTSGAEIGQLQKIEVKNGSSANIAKAEYTYYGNVSGGSADLGSAGDLVQVKTSRIASNGTDWIVRYLQYRYYTGTSGPRDGSTHQLKMVLESDAIERLNTAGDSAIDTPDELLTKDDDYAVGASELADFSSRSFTYYTADLDTDASITTAWGSENLNTKYGPINLDEYNTSAYGRVKSERVNGSCGTCSASGAAGVTMQYYYMSLNTGTSTDTGTVIRVVVEDTLDTTGAPLFRTIYGINDFITTLRTAVIEDPTAGTLKAWCQSWTMSASLRMTEERSPSAHTLIDSNAEITKFLDPSTGSNDADTLNTSAGQIKVFEYDGNNRPSGTRVKMGSSGTAYYVASVDYGDGSTVPVQYRTATYDYPTQTTTRATAVQTTASYSFWDGGKKQLKKITITLPSIGTSQNGPNVSAVIEQYFDKLGRMRWTKDALGYVNYYSYHPDNGQEAYVAIDVDPASMPGSATGNDTKWVAATEDGDGNGTYDSSGIPTRSGAISTPLELVTQGEYDDLARRVKVTAPGGAMHYDVYEDDRIIQFPYWDATASESQLPIQVSVIDNGGRRSQSYAVRADYSAIAVTSSRPTGFSTNPSQSDYVRWTKLSYDALSNKLATIDRYHDIPSSGSGTLSTNFDRIVLHYDDQGRRTHVIQTVSGTSTSAGVEQVQQTIYDFLGRPTELKSGVSSSSQDMGSGYDTYPTLRTLRKVVYDGSAVGDSHVTKQMRYHGTGANNYTGVNLHPTYRGHNRGLEPFYNSGGTETASGPYTVLDVDWRGLTTAQGRFKSNLTWATVLTGDGYTAYASSTATSRGTLTEATYDDLRRPFQTKEYAINTSSGAKGSAVQDDVFFDLNGQVVAGGDLLGGVATEVAYDAAGRQYQTRNVLQLESTKFSSGLFAYRAPEPKPDLSSMSGGDDQVITLAHNVLDDSGNVTAQHQFDMNHDDTTNVGIDLSNNDDYVRSTAYSWYDSADRLTATGNYGSGDTTAGVGTWKYAAIPTRPGSAPSTGSTVLVSSYGYDSETSELAFVTDPIGRQTKTFEDDLGRTTWLAEHFDNFAPTSLGTIGDGSDGSKDRITKTEYNGLGGRTKLIAYNGSSGSAQNTLYLYEDAVNALRVTSTIYPDSSDTMSSGTDQVKFTYNVDGLPSARTDQRGTVITYGYDNLRRSQSQQATTLGGSTDGTVLSLTRKYNNLGRLSKYSSHGNLTSDPDNTTSVLNQVVLTYDDFGHVTKSEQSHSGVVSSSPSVQMAYSTVAASGLFNNKYRQLSLTYPNGRVLYYHFGTNDDLSDRLNSAQRLRETDSSGASWMRYSLTGSGRTMIADAEDSDVRQNLFLGTTGTYAGLDRFGRIKDFRWQDYTSGIVTLAQYGYGYDSNGNRLYAEDMVAASNSVNQDELYAFDGLDRLTAIDRGNLTTSNTVIASKTFSQDFGLDQLNNWPTFNQDTDGNGTDDLTQARTMNAANEITQVDAASTYVAHDAAGNMTTAVKPSSWSAAYTLTWDAWNRLVKVQDGGSTVAEYQYDARNRRIVKKVYASGSLDHTEHNYLSEQNQVLEVRKDSGTTAWKQFTWGNRYIDDLVFRTRDTNADGTLDEQLYALQDANWNVTALTNTSGTVVERFRYDPYGSSTVLDANFTLDANGLSDYDWEYRFTNREYDSETGLSYFRARYWHPTLGRFIGRDPLGYIDGGSLYAGYFVPGGVDPNGLALETFVDVCGLGLDLYEFYRSPSVYNAGMAGWSVGATFLPGIPGSWVGRAAGAAADAVNATDNIVDVGKVADDFADAGKVGDNVSTGGKSTSSVGKADSCPSGDSGIQFGNNPNQRYHAFRHVNSYGLDESVVQAAILEDMLSGIGSITDGLNVRKIIVDGVEITYHAFKLPDGTINIGRITPP